MLATLSKTFCLQLTTDFVHVAVSVADQTQLALQVHKGYLSILKQSGQSAPDLATNGEDAMEEDDSAYSAQDSKKAWRSRTLAALGAFLRSHYMHVAPVAPQIEQLLGDGIAEDIKQVVLKNLIL